MKDIKFSTAFPKGQFPKGHPKFCNPTYFVEKIWRYLIDSCEDPERKKSLLDLNFFYLDPYDLELWDRAVGIDVEPKSHTIRKGHRFKAGEWFAPKVWTGKPYRSKTYQFAPAIEIKKVFDFKITNNQVLIDGMLYATLDLNRVAKNDGLRLCDFFDWFQFPKDFDGQIICWNDQISY